MARFRKKPVVIEAFQLGIDYIPDWFMDKVTTNDIILHGTSSGFENHDDINADIKTLEGWHHANFGDFIIKGTAGEIYPCKPHIFKDIYESADTTADVAPKSEVDRLTVELDAMRGAANTYKMHYENAMKEIERLKDYNTGVAFKHYFDGRKEVAREIFEEIYKSVALKIPMGIRPIFKDDRDFDGGFINGKRDALLDVLVLIAELKKKYTEGE